MTENEKTHQKLFDAVNDSIMNADIPEEEKSKLQRNLLHLREQKINLMVTGATGCGKSSTINALFNTEKAKVGVGVDPETMEISRYELDNLILWDTPGLGDGKVADERHTKNIVRKLRELDENGNYLIDLVLVILDGGSRDLGTSYDLINNVIIPNLGEDKKNRILIAINQCDVAMKGRYWNEEECKPEPQLEKFLEEKVESVRKRIMEGTGVDITPIYYSAGYKEEGMPQSKPYNLSKLLYYIVTYTPEEKRLALVDNINKDKDTWAHDDGKSDYNASTESEFAKTLEKYGTPFADAGEQIGSVFGDTGAEIGRTIGAGIGIAVGVGVSIVKALNPFRWF